MLDQKGCGRFKGRLSRRRTISVQKRVRGLHQAVGSMPADRWSETRRQSLGDDRSCEMNSGRVADRLREAAKSEVSVARRSDPSNAGDDSVETLP